MTGLCGLCLLLADKFKKVRGQLPLGRLMKIIKRAFPGEEDEHGEYPLSTRGYFIGLSIIFASAYSQYLIKGFGPMLALLIVYGIPISVISFLFGSAILRAALRHTLTALKLGLSLFGIFSLSGILAGSAIFSFIVMLDPQAANLLNRPNPVLHVPPEFAWIMAWFSLIFVGPAEEYIFRGFVYGGLLSLFKNRHWLSLAFFSSLLFAVAHLYYALVYGIASLALFVELFLIGAAFAITYYLSGGNLLVPAILHGLYDASGFMGVAVSKEVGILLRMSLMGAGIVVALGLFARMLFSRSSRP
jgi:membrane protease YdiL (CAAX protease family)